MFLEIAPKYAAQIFDTGPAGLARQSVMIQQPYLAQMARIRYLQKKNGAPQKPSANRSSANTIFKRSQSWFKPWSMAHELATRVKWDPKAPFGAEFAREEAQRQTLTKLFADCLNLYEQQTKAEGLRTDDLAVTFGHTVALNSQLSTGRKMPPAEEAALSQKFRDEFAQSPWYWPDSSKQSLHETIVITTMLAQIGYANATRDKNPDSQAMFRQVAAENVTALTSASLDELRDAQTALSFK